MFLEKYRKAGIKQKFMFWLGSILVFSMAFISIFAPFISPYSPREMVGGSQNPPSIKHPMGTTKLGYDVSSKTIYGGRMAFAVGIIASVLALSFGLPLGLVSGYTGGALDRILVMLMDALYSFPGLLLAIMITAMIGPGVFNAALAVFVVFTPQYFRVVRNHTLSIKEETFVEASRAVGSSTLYILIRDIFLNVVQSVPVIFSSNAASAILVLAGLSFLGLGITPPTPSLGYELSAAQRYLDNGIWWRALFPGIFMVMIISGFSFLGEGLNEILNPPADQG